MRVVVATPEDIPAWLDLAREVEIPYFGPLVDDPQFNASLQRTIERGTAFCVRDKDGAPGTTLAGGLLFSAKPPTYKIGWLAVAAAWRRNGIGKSLVARASALIQPPAELTVVTYAEGSEIAPPARQFYEHIGLQPAEPAPPTPLGYPCQVFRRSFP